MQLPSLTATLLAAATNIIIGMLWYGPVFGDYWLELVSKKDVDQTSNPKHMAFAVVLAVVSAGLLDAAASALGVTGAIQGALLGATIAVGFVFTTHANKVLWSKEPVKLYILNMAHFFVSFGVMGAIVATV